MHWDKLTVEEQNYLKVREEDLEIGALDSGIARFHRENARQPMSKWPACRALIATATQSLAIAITAEQIKIAEGRGMQGGNQWGHVFLYMEPEVLAAATIIGIFDCLSSISPTRSGTQQDMITTVGQRMEMETHFTILKREAPRLKAVMERKIKRWNHRSLRAAMNRIEEDCADRWTLKRRRIVGAKLVGLAIEHSGLFKFSMEYMPGRNIRAKKLVVLTDEAAETISKMNDHLEILSPIYKPMICPPNDWGEFNKGGYLLLHRYHNIVKSGIGYPDEMPTDHGQIVYNAINALQKTPWTINVEVYDVMESVWKQGGNFAGLPHAEDLPIPIKPDVEDDSEWRKSAEKIYRSNARAIGKRIAFLQILEVSEQLYSEVFYFPHQCDFRGRVYPIPQFLQPQGSDIARGLLTFADAKPLGENGLRWLYIQYANCWGMDKISFDERVCWAYDMVEDSLKSIADYPLSYKQFWVHADDPWQALATLMEIRNAIRSDNQEQYMCKLPVNVDGSNSGLQHFSAMLRDSEGARLVNLTPSTQPSDIYTDVATCVEQAIKVEYDAKEVGGMNKETDTDLADAWLKSGIDRKLCKRGTMTYCYGVTQQGLNNALVDDGFVDWADNQFSAVTYLGKKIWAAIQQNITGATEAMNWLRKCADAGNKAGVLLEWRTPSGFRVNHPYYNPREVRVKCLSGEAIFKVYDPNKTISKHKQRNGLPPNFVHSLDASHLVMTVAAGSANGIDHWMMIHDSFGTHACDMDLLRDVLREQFVNLYTVDVLEEFRKQVTDQTGIDPGESPAKGDFNLDSVLESDYIFA